jgi:predicted flavoprotein YhiN
MKKLVIIGRGPAALMLAAEIQDALSKKENVVVELDLRPTMTFDQINAKYQKSKKSKITEILNSDLNLDRTAIGIIKHFTDKETFLNSELLIKTIKSLPVKIEGADELDKAISSLGGVALDEVDKNFRLTKIPNTFVIGEMLDWFAPTGGYLLQGCFSMGFALSKFLNNLEK